MKTHLIELALKEYATHETPDVATSDPRVIEYFKESGNSWVHDDTNNAWCSAFMNFVVKKAGFPYTKILLARSWLKMGKKVTEPEIGDVVIFWRDDINGPHGHVSLFIRKVGNLIYCLGGNQNDQVNIMAYDASRVLGYRDVTLPADPMEAPIFLKNLRKGDRGDDVSYIQRELGVPVDGSFGPITDTAVRTFQKNHHLAVDGIVGPLTLKELLK